VGDKIMNNTTTLKEIKIKGYSVSLFKEPDPGETGYKMFAEVKGLSGCFIAGDTEKEIIEQAPDVIEMFLEAQKEIEKGKPKLVSVKVKPALYDFFVKYADEKGIENVSTAVRSLAVTQLRHEGYSVPSKYAAVSR
jgi:predicted RNase H-like HicB family nuclease